MTSQEYSFQAGDSDHWSLIVDTSRTTGFISSLGSDFEILNKISWGPDERHTDVLLKNYLTLTNHLDFKKLSKIYFIQGPGSFTGLRVGAAFVKALSFSLKTPIECRSSFLLDALSVINNNPKIQDFNVLIPSIGDKFFLAHFKYSNGTWIEKIDFDGAKKREFDNELYFSSFSKPLSKFNSLKKTSTLDEGFDRSFILQNKIQFYSHLNTHLDLYPLYLRQSEAEEKIRYDKTKLQQIKKK